MRSKISGRLLVPARSLAQPNDVDVSRGCIGADRAGNVWFAGHQGLFRHDGDRIDRFQFTGTFAFTSIAASADCVYFATNAGLLGYRDDEFRLLCSDSTPLPDDQPKLLATDATGRVYLLACESERPEWRIGVLDGGTFSLLRPGVDFPAGLAVRTLAIGADGTLVLGGDGGFAVRSGGEWSVESTFDQWSASGSAVDAVAIDQDAVWLGTSSGVHRYRRGRFEFFGTGPVNCLCLDGDLLWVGTADGPLTSIRNGTTKRYADVDPTVATTSIEGLTRATDGTVWLHTNHGVARFHHGRVHRLDPDAPPPDAPPPDAPTPTARPPLPARPLVARQMIPTEIVEACRALASRPATADLLLNLVRPAIELAPRSGGSLVGGAVPVGGSKIGGRPDLPDGVRWPRLRGDNDHLPFLLQIDLAEAHPFDLEGLLPAEGILHLFCDLDFEDIGDSRVLLTPGGEPVRRRELPDDLAQLDAMDEFLGELPESGLVLSQRWTLPSTEFVAERVNLRDDDRRTMSALRKALDAGLGAGPDTGLDAAGSGSQGGFGPRLLGWPDNLQGEFVRDEQDVVLLQLDASRLVTGPVGPDVERWRDVGLIHFVGRAKHLRAGKLGRFSAFLTYT